MYQSNLPTTGHPDIRKRQDKNSPSYIQDLILNSTLVMDSMIDLVDSESI